MTLDQFRDAKHRIEKARDVNGYVLTHIGLLCRSDGKLFSPDDADSAMEALYWFLSFAAGWRCPLALPTGLRHLGYPLWQQWAIYSGSQIRTRNNWFRISALRRCFVAADNFYTCWSDDTKRDWLKSAIGLYLACNHNHGGVELVLSESQIALEMLCWVALLEENSLMSEKGFEKLEAADRLRALLFWLGISPSIPDASVQLRSTYPTFDAPHAVVDIRNSIIHPTKSNRGKRALLSDETIFEAWQLNMWYIELAILKLIGYEGAYNNRIRNRAGHIFDLVPWTSPNKSS